MKFLSEKMLALRWMEKIAESILENLLLKFIIKLRLDLFVWILFKIAPITELLNSVLNDSFSWSNIFYRMSFLS